MLNIEIVNLLIIILSGYNILVESNESRVKRRYITIYAVVLVIASVFNIINYFYGFGRESFVIVRHSIYGIIEIILYWVLLLNLNIRINKPRLTFILSFIGVYILGVTLISVFNFWQVYDPSLSNNTINPVAFINLVPTLSVAGSIIIRRKHYHNLFFTLVYLAVPIVCFITQYCFPNFYIYSVSYTLILFFLSSFNHSKAISQDKLTGVLNRHALERNFKNNLTKHTKGFVYFIDLDGFKEVNDTFGHKMGDKVLKDFADILKASVLNSDKIYRYGGDEFVIISNSASNKNTMLETLLNNVKIYNSTHSIKLAYSCGVNQISKNVSMSDIVDMADQKMYEEKLIHKKAQMLNSTKETK